MLTRLREARRSDDGMTLMELVVAMAVSAILAVMAGYFFIGTSNTSTAATEQSLQTSQARDALQQWTQLIRVADSPSQAGIPYGRITGSVGPSSLTFWAALGNRVNTSAAGGLSSVTLTMAGGKLSQTITDPSGTKTTRILLGCAATYASSCASGGQVVSGRFTPYYTGTGCPAASLTAAGLCVIDPAADPSVDDVLAIGITFTVDGLPGREHAAAQSYSTLVTVGSAT